MHRDTEELRNREKETPGCKLGDRTANRRKKGFCAAQRLQRTENNGAAEKNEAVISNLIENSLDER